MILFYDLETYPNCFTMCVASETSDPFVFECSSRRNDMEKIMRLCAEIKHNKVEMVGFNNIGFDYPIMHMLMNMGYEEDISGEEYAFAVNMKAEEIIKSRDKFKHIIWDRDRHLPQIDLYKINHFDNKNRATSLKQIEFAMRSHSLSDLPFDPKLPLHSESQVEELRRYNKHDVIQTRNFFLKCEKDLDFRRSLVDKFGYPVMNYNDTKIGKQTFIRELEESLGNDICFYKSGGRRKPRQTPREFIDLEECVSDKIRFETAPFQSALDWVKSQTITETKGVFKDVDFTSNLDAEILNHTHSSNLIKYTLIKDRESDELLYRYRNNGSKNRINKTIKDAGGEDNVAVSLDSLKMKKVSIMVNDFEVVYGLGGLHGSVKNQAFFENDDWVILDADVVSYYTSTAITLKTYPEHLGEKFCEIYDRLKTHRLEYDKGTVENKSLKLALNGVYGDSNNKYSPFYDPKYTMTVTLNGQMFLSMLLEKLLAVDSLVPIQVNTDGLTVAVKKRYLKELVKIFTWWQRYTGLDLEFARYKSMFIKDVNNYIAVKGDGELKLKGCYEIEREWHKNHSELVVPKVARDYLIDGGEIEDIMKGYDDLFDYMIFVKATGKTYLQVETEDGEFQTIQNRSRFLVTTQGVDLKLVYPPLKKDPDKERPRDVRSDRKVLIINDYNESQADVIRNELLDYDYYIEEVRKITNFKEVEYE